MTIDDDTTPSTAPTSAIRAYLRGSISIAGIVGLLWSGRWIVLATTILGLFYGAYEVHKGGPVYMATMHVAPAETDTAAAASGASGLLAGLTGGGGGAMVVPKFTQFLAAIGSVGVADLLDQKYGMLCRVFRGDCDQVTHQWTERTGWREWINAQLAALGGLPNPNLARTTIDLAAYNGGSIQPADNKNNSIVVLSYATSDPKFAAFYLSLVVKASNDYIRGQNRETQRRYVNYVTEAIGRNTNVDQRSALDSLLLQEERQLMMAEVDVPYAATILDGPTVIPINRVNRIVAIDTILGAIIGMAIAFFRQFLPAVRRRLRF